MRSNEILGFLRENKSGYFSGEEISKKLKVTRSAVWKEIQSLKRLGYEIEAQPHLGYRLLAIPDKIFADDLAYGLNTRFIGHQIFSYEELNSTNDAAFHLGEQGVKEGACVFAEYQKKGRGRLGRHWASPKSKNIILSVLLRPTLLPQEASKLTLACAVSAVRATRKFTGKTLGIKWPNDIYYQRKKIGGILTEMSAESDRIHFIVVGIGINVNSASSELPANSISLKEIMGCEQNRLARFLMTAAEPPPDVLNRLKDRLRPHHHAGPAAVRPVVHRAAPIMRVVPQIVHADRQPPALLGALNDRFAQHRWKHRRKEGDDVHPHGKRQAFAAAEDFLCRFTRLATAPEICAPVDTQ